MVKLSPEKIVATARTYIGTPWHHCGRVKGVGIDCAGLLVLVSNELEVPVADDASYSLGDEYERMINSLEKYCNYVPSDQVMCKADILVFRDRRMYNHCGIYNGEGGMIHAYNSPSVAKVVETTVNDTWLKRLVAVYRYKGL